MARELTKIAVNLKPELVKQIDAYAYDMGLTRTSACAVLLNQALTSNQALSDLNDVMKVLEDQGLVPGKKGKGKTKK